MDNDEIKALLRELKARSDADDAVKSSTIKINFGEEDPPILEESRGISPFRKKRKKKERQKEIIQEEKIEKEEMDDWKADSENQPEEVTETEKEKTEKKKEKKSGQEKKKKKKAKKEPSTFLEEDFQADSEDFRETDALLQEAKKAGAIGRSPWKNLKLAVRSYFAEWKAKGIGEREWIMIGFGVILVIFLIFAVYSAIFSEDKSIHVTADEGLYVTVEEEPEIWCSSGTVVLGIRTGSVIQSITVNGETVKFESGKRTTISVDVSSEKIELMAVTEEQVLNASIEIPMIDAEAPEISIQQENGQVTMSALDERSGLEGIYYGTVSGFSEVPFYQKYTGPFLYEPGRIYYYYAKDLAGNKTVPTATNMEPAQGIQLNQEEFSLLLGDQSHLQFCAVPEMAYLNQLQIINQNPEIIDLSADGVITAKREGTAVIEVKAEGLPAAECTVHILSETEVTVTAVGDCTLGSDVNFNPSNSFDTVYAMYGADYFLQNVRSIFEADDITFANFEGTLTTSDAREPKQFAFKGDPSYTDILKNSSVEVVTLANNHSSDYGAQSNLDTKNYLTEAGIAYCTGTEIAYQEVNGVKIACIGIYVLDTGMEKETQVRETIAAAKQEGADLIITAFHWGSEKSNYPDETQQSLAHTAVDCGADLVIGHHPHVLQGIEQYQGKYIVYSLGNFCFGGNSNPSDTDTMIFQQTFSLNQEREIVDSRVEIIPCSITSQYGWNNYQPTPQEGTEAERILNRIEEYSVFNE